MMSARRVKADNIIIYAVHEQYRTFVGYRLDAEPRLR